MAHLAVRIVVAAILRPTFRQAAVVTRPCRRFYVLNDRGAKMVGLVSYRVSGVWCLKVREMPKVLVPIKHH